MAERLFIASGALALALLCGACSSDDDDAADEGGPHGPPTTTTGQTFEDGHEGVYHLGPVDFDETEWHNACAPIGGYRAELRASVGLAGAYLAGVSTQFSQNGGVCDACILIETGTGKSIVARVVTYGVEQAAGDIDVSPSVYEALHTGEFPRSMTWRFARCPEAGGLQYEFQTEANAYWTSLWVRNPRVPLIKAEVKSRGDSDFVPLARGTDGTLTDSGGFGEGAFTLRLTGMDGQVISQELPGFAPGQLVKSELQFE
jgi:expansin (peptidoglycan-binding protein)